MSFLSDYFKKCINKKRRSGKDRSISTWSGSVSKNTPIDQCPFVVFDTELSGLDARKDFIVSIGAIKMTGGLIHTGKEFYRLIRPTGEMTRKSVEIHGMTPDELYKKENLETVLPDFLEFIQDAVLVGHFINIDLKFMKKALKNSCGYQIKNPALDTHTVHEWIYENGVEFKKHYHGGSTKTDLFSVAQRYGITVEAAHDALGDAFITAQLFQRFLHFLHAEGMQKLSELSKIGRA
jgi:DNA polymerase-3 subunit epsilon